MVLFQLDNFTHCRDIISWGKDNPEESPGKVYNSTEWSVWLHVEQISVS